MERDGLLENAERTGGYLMERLHGELGGLPGVREIRGRGLMVGIELDRPCGELVRRCLDAGLVLNVTADTVIRLLPPLIFAREHVDRLVDTLAPMVRDLLATKEARAA